MMLSGWMFPSHCGAKTVPWMSCDLKDCVRCALFHAHQFNARERMDDGFGARSTSFGDQFAAE
jgi:hypothetical protein